MIMLLFTLFLMLYMLYSLLIIIHICMLRCEGMPFMTFVRRSLYPWGNNASKDEGH
jgi:hypothetical protein